MIRRNTWILLLILAALIGFAYYLKAQKAKTEAAATPAAPQSTALFGPEQGLVSDILIETAIGESVEIGRDATGQWVLKKPINVPADQSLAESAASQVQALEVVSNLQIGLDVVGLDKPGITMTLGFTGGRQHILTIGSVTPIQTGYYARLDGGQVLILSKDSIDALLKLLTNPPLAATPTGTASPAGGSETGTATPTP